MEREIRNISLSFLFWQESDSLLKAVWTQAAVRHLRMNNCPHCLEKLYLDLNTDTGVNKEETGRLYERHLNLEMSVKVCQEFFS